MIFDTNKLHKSTNEMVITLCQLLFVRGRYKPG